MIQYVHFSTLSPKRGGIFRLDTRAGGSDSHVLDQLFFAPNASTHLMTAGQSFTLSTPSGNQPL